MSAAIELDWRRLRGALVAGGVCALLAAGAGGAAWWHERAAARSLEEATARLDGARARYATLARDHREWNRLGALFGAWHANGRIGEPRPDLWSEGLARAANGVGARLVRHRMSPPRDEADEGAGDEENNEAVVVRATDLQLDLALRHEGELPALLRALERETRGLFTVSGCQLKHTPAHGKEASVGIDASCRLRWETVAPADADPGQWLSLVASGDGDTSPRETTSWPAVALALFPPPEGVFGRLFTSPEERARRSAVPDTIAPPPPRTTTAASSTTTVVMAGNATSSPAALRQVRLSGIIARNGSPIFAWIDGKRTRRTPPESASSRNPNTPATPRAATAIRLNAGEHSIWLRPGQRFDPATGRVLDPLRPDAPLAAAPFFRSPAARRAVRVMGE